MPIYEFHCQKCERDSEVLVRSSKWEGTPCPHCGSPKLVKQLSVFAPNAASAQPETACGMAPGSCGSCCGGGPHRH